MARALWRGALIIGLIVVLGACSTSGALHIDRSVQARSQSSRVAFIVLHYTSSNTPIALNTLSRQNVSSHYLVTDDTPAYIYQLVDENRRAWHAGASQWCGRTWLNAASIGIELVNTGQRNNRWAPYPADQIDTLITLLHEVSARHQIKSVNVVGHSDIAAQRKIDPGPRFPWKQLAQAGIGRWYDESALADVQRELLQTTLPDARWVQTQLAMAGYATPNTGILDPATRNVVTAFQMHYRPERYDGWPDVETMSILKILNNATDPAARCPGPSTEPL